MSESQRKPQSDPRSNSRSSSLSKKAIGLSPNGLMANGATPNGATPGSAGQLDVDTVVLPSMDDEFKAPVDKDAEALALTMAEAADDRKAGNITILRTGEISYLADYFVIVTGFSNVQVRAIANSIESAVEDKFDRQPLRNEGMSEGRWVLKDYGEVIVHIFMPTDREFYDLESFWGHAERVEFVPTSPDA